MAAAYDSGVNFFDNAEIYARGQSEEIMGKVLKELGLAAAEVRGLDQVLLGHGSRQR